MKKYLFTLICFLLFSVSFSQGNPKVKKAIKIFNSGKFDKGIKKMQKVTDKDPRYENWDMLVRMYKERYSIMKQKSTDDLMNALLSVSTKKGDQTIYYSDASTYFVELINKSREATRLSVSPVASQYLRSYLIDYETDTSVSKEAKEKFQEGENFFIQKDFENAKESYLSALKINPGYYKALIYLGDSYWYLKDMDSAVYCFEKGVEIHNDLLEPRKYIVDALGYSKQYSRAKRECIDGICVYPDNSMFMKYEGLAKRTGKTFDRKWIPRLSEVNSLKQEEEESENSAWKVYQKAENEIAPYCDSNGLIVKANELTKSKYMEVYCWEKMLENKQFTSIDFKFAKKMKEEGYLNCYVFISLFHNDLYPQFKHFSKNNKSKIEKYMAEKLTTN